MLSTQKAFDYAVMRDKRAADTKDEDTANRLTKEELKWAKLIQIL